MIAQWLKVGVVEQGRLHRTEEPQAGWSAPCCLNVALHGMEQAAGVRYQTISKDASQIGDGLLSVLIRYADDLVAGHSRDEALPDQGSGSPAGWRPEDWSSTRTRRVSSASNNGFDFLGFNVRRYHGKLLIKPSKAAITRARERLRTEMRSLRGANARAVIRTAQPDHPGLGSLQPGRGVQRGIRTRWTTHVWKLTWKWADLQPLQQAEGLGHHPVLRRVQQIQARPVGIRRPPKRHLPTEVRLDQNRPTPRSTSSPARARPRTTPAPARLRSPA